MLKQKIVKKYDIVEGSLETLLSQLKKEVFTDAFLEEWRGEDYAEDYACHGTEWDGNREECPEEELKDICESYLHNRFWDFEAEFKRHAKEKLGGLIAYRVMEVKDINKFITDIKQKKYQKGFTGVGIFYSWKESAAQAHWGKGGDSLKVVAIIPFSAIDVKSMAEANMMISTGEDEKEITVEPGSQVIVKKILDKHGNNLLGEDLMSLPAVAEK